MGFTEKNRWRGGRAPKKWVFTVADVAAATGLTVAQARRLLNDPDVVDPSDLVSLATFVVERRGEAAAVAARAVVATASRGTGAGAAVLGISRATLYRRARAKP